MSGDIEQPKQYWINRFYEAEAEAEQLRKRLTYIQEEIKLAEARHGLHLWFDHRAVVNISNLIADCEKEGERWIKQAVIRQA